MREIGIDRSRRLRAFAAVLGVVAAFVGASASSAVAVPANFWGVVPQATPTEAQLQRLKAGGVDSLRMPMNWAGIQPVRGGQLDFSATDVLVGGAAKAGIEVLPYLSGAPTWAVPEMVIHYRRSKIRAVGSLPVRTGLQRSAWSSFLSGAVSRYGPSGSFWAENPAVPFRPVRAWQIWNEPNFMYFVARPNPAEYGKLVKLSSTAIRGVDPGAKVILAGLFSRPFEATESRKPPLAYFATDFLAQMYKTTPGIKSKFQGVALHPYTSNYKRLIPYTEEFRDVLKANGDAGKGLWITELGWSSQRPTEGNSFAKGRGGQAAQLKGSFRLLRDKQVPWRVQRVYWYSIDDQVGTCNFCDGSGLFGEGFVPKPAWRAFVAFSGGSVG